jgi:hypothetical protein
MEPGQRPNEVGNANLAHQLEGVRFAYQGKGENISVP